MSDGLFLDAVTRKAQTDVAAYIRTTDEEALISLLSSIVGSLALDPDGVSDFRIYTGSSVVLIVEDWRKGFLGIFLRGNTPWISHVRFARFLSDALHCEVLCDPGSEHPEVNPYSDVMLRVHEGHETLVDCG